MPESRIRSGWKPFLRLISTSSSRQTKAPSTPPSNIRGSGKAGSSKAVAITPIKVPPLTPSSSGLAMGLLLTRCNRVPASASSTPAAPAANARGRRHSSWACHLNQLGQCQPSIPCPNSREAITANTSPINSRPIRRTGAPWRATVRSLAALGAPDLKASRGISQSSSGAPSRAVMAPVGISTGQKRVRDCSSRSVAASSRAPSTGAHSRRKPSCLTPSIRTITGAASPMKPISPTTLTTQAVMKTARPRPAKRSCLRETPRLRALASSSSNTARGRTSSAASTTATSNRGSR
ncbi:hypothetical protein D3C85_1183850 [compost metagenome]